MEVSYQPRWFVYGQTETLRKPQYPLFTHPLFLSQAAKRQFFFPKIEPFNGQTVRLTRNLHRASQILIVHPGQPIELRKARVVTLLVLAFVPSNGDCQCSWRDTFFSNHVY